MRAVAPRAYAPYAAIRPTRRPAGRAGRAPACDSTYAQNRSARSHTHIRDVADKYRINANERYKEVDMDTLAESGTGSVICKGPGA